MGLGSVQLVSEHAWQLWEAQEYYELMFSNLKHYDSTDPGWGDYAEASAGLVSAAKGVNESLEFLGKEPFFPVEFVNPVGFAALQYEQWTEYSHKSTEFGESLTRYAFEPTPGNIDNISRTGFDALAAAGLITLSAGVYVLNPAMMVLGAAMIGLGMFAGPPRNKEPGHPGSPPKKHDDPPDAPLRIPGRVPGPYRDSQNYFPRRDPLVLDLDGDGVETVGLASSKVLFDHDADGIKTRTGWAGPDDGFVVLDRNGNGVVDDGRELFGDATPLNHDGSMDSTAGIAAHGFAALEQEDSNASGAVEAGDARWGKLRIWQDLNQDGLSQPAELNTLDALGISAINLANTELNSALPDGNQINRMGSFRRAGKNQAAATLGDAANLNFAEDTFHRIFTDKLPLPADFDGLPVMEGSGKVRDLQEAATLSPRLDALFRQFSAMPERDGQLALVEPLLEAWADTSGMAASLDERNRAKFVVRYERMGKVKRADNIVKDSTPAPGAAPRDVDNPALTRSYRDLVASWNKKLHILEAFNGCYFFALPDESQQGRAALSGLTVSAMPGSGVPGGEPGPAMSLLTVTYSSVQLDFLDAAYAALREAVYVNLVLQSRFKPYLASVKLAAAEHGFRYDFSEFERMVRAGMAQSPATTMCDLIEMNKYARRHFGDHGWPGFQLMESLIRSEPVTAPLQAVYATFGVTIAGKPGFSGTGTVADEVMVAGDGADQLDAGGGDDMLFGGGEKDSLRAGAGADYLDGGTGDDRLNGGAGSDVYRFGRDSGDDTIEESSDDAVNTDMVMFDVGIAPADVSVKRDGLGSDLLLTLAGSGNVLRIVGYFRNDGNNPYVVEQIRFADGTAWRVGDVKAMVIRGTAGRDTIVGYASDDMFDGGAGNDWLNGAGGSDVYRFGRESDDDTIEEGSDASPNTDIVQLDAGITPADVTLKRDGTGSDLLLTLAGSGNVLRMVGYFRSDGASGYVVEQIRFADGTAWTVDAVKALVMQGTPGRDTIVGYGSADVLDGGAGDDWLNGAAGSDVYRFGKDSDDDTIEEGGDASRNTDVVQLEAGITPADVSVRRDGVGSDLLLTLAGSGNVLRIVGYFRSDGDNPYVVEQIRFADGTSWNVDTVKAMVVRGTPARDTIVGYGGADVLDGGAGDDWLNGGAGSDVYRFGKESDDDTIEEGSDTARNTDVVQLDAGIAPADVSVRRDGIGSDLLLTLAGSGNVLRIKNYFYQDGASGYLVEQIRFADGTVWNVDAIKARMLLGTAGDDTIVGYAGADVLDGAGGKDWLDGKGGTDTYKFGRESGNDTIEESSETSRHTDVVKFDADIVPADVTVKRDSNDLLLTLAGSGNVLRIKNYFYQDGASGYVVEQIRFADGTVWNVDAIKARMLVGTAGDDTIVGYAGADVLDGAGGNDWLDGKGGNDIYKFGKQSGNDTIAETSDTSRNTDSVQLDADIAPADVSVKRNANDLMLTLAGADNVLRIKDYFYLDGASGYVVEQIRFADGTVWNVDTVKARLA
jgi:Ca2+-binding RTX toxin-like protein